MVKFPTCVPNNINTRNITGRLIIFYMIELRVSSSKIHKKHTASSKYSCNIPYFSKKERFLGALIRNGHSQMFWWVTKNWKNPQLERNLFECLWRCLDLFKLLNKFLAWKISLLEFVILHYYLRRGHFHQTNNLIMESKVQKRKHKCLT